MRQCNAEGDPLPWAEEKPGLSDSRQRFTPACATDFPGLLSGMRPWTFLLLLLSWIGPALASARACPGCQEAVSATRGNAGEILAGFSLSVLFMIAAVFVALAGLAALIVRATRRIEAARAKDHGLPRA